VITRERTLAAWVSIDDLPTEFTCSSVILNSIHEVVLEEFAVLWDSISEKFKLQSLVEIEYALLYI